MSLNSSFAPKPIDLSDIAALENQTPARQAMYAGIAHRRPELLSGFAHAEGRDMQNMIERAYSQSDDVNQMLNSLSQQDLGNDARKNEIDLFKQMIQGQASDGYRGGIGPIVDQSGYPDLGRILGEYNAFGDTQNLDETNANAYGRRVSADAAMENARANRARASNEGKMKTKFSYNALNQLVPSYEFPGILSPEQAAEQGVPTYAPQGGPGGQGIDIEASTGTPDPVANVTAQRAHQGLHQIGRGQHKYSVDGKDYTVITYQGSDGKQYGDVIDADGNIVDTNIGQ